MMKKLLYLVLSLITSVFAFTQTNWRQGILVDEFIATKMPFPESHAASIAEIPSGLVVAWFGGTKERNPDVEIWVSRKTGTASWSAPVSVANGIINDTLRYACWNPVLYKVPGGNLLLFYKVGPSPSAWKGWMKISKDDGLTWSSAIALPNDCLGPIKNKPILLANGTLISPVSTEGSGWNLHFEFSNDNGLTWTRGQDLKMAEGIKAIQPTIFVHKHGQLQLLSRTQQRYFAEAWSNDFGKTWSDVKLSAIPNNNSGADGVTLKDGRHVLVYNHVIVPDSAKGGKGARTPLNVALSNNGKKWMAVNILEDSPISQYSYPSVIQSSDGMIHVVYTWRRESIKYVKIDPSVWNPISYEGLEWPK